MTDENVNKLSAYLLACTAEGVAQISNLLYRGFLTCERFFGLRTPLRLEIGVQQIGNLRYNAVRVRS